MLFTDMEPNLRPSEELDGFTPARRHCQSPRGAGNESARTGELRHRRTMLPYCIVIILIANFHLVSSSMCQYHQAALLASQAMGNSKATEKIEDNLANSRQAGSSHSNLLFHCPKASQFNNLPQFPPKFTNPNLERQQRDIMKHLNASFTNHLNNQEPAMMASDLIDDELLNEIISPLMIDDAYLRAKELIVKRRKFENELVKQGW